MDKPESTHGRDRDAVGFDFTSGEWIKRLERVIGVGLHKEHPVGDLIRFLAKALFSGLQLACVPVRDGQLKPDNAELSQTG